MRVVTRGRKLTAGETKIMSSATSKLFFWPSVVMIALTSGATIGVGLAKFLKKDSYEFIVSDNNFEADVNAALEKYESVKDKGNFKESLTIDEMVNVSYALFEQEEQTWTRGVGASIAMGLVEQKIYSTTVHDHEKFFEESVSTSNIVTIYDRMFQEGDETVTYWGSNADYASHPAVTYSNDEYKKLMGRYVSTALIYIVSPKTILYDESLSGKPNTGVTESGDDYIIEVELSPKYGVLNYQSQMKTISDLANRPPFDYCHLTITMAKDLTLKKMVTFEKYTATTKMGIGSSAEGSLATAYYHEAPSFGFPEPGSVLPAYPASI